MSRTAKALSWSGVAALLGLLVSVSTGFIAIGRRDAVIDQKLEKVEYLKDQTTLERSLGVMQADIRVIRSAVCASQPRACQ